MSASVISLMLEWSVLGAAGSKLGVFVFKVRMTQVPGTKTVINEYSVQSEIINSGMGVSNPEHLDLLNVLCQESSKQTSHSSG